MSREVSRSVSQTTLGGKYNEENTTELCNQECLSEMLSKVLEATFGGHLSWDLKNKELTMWRSKGKKLQAAKSVSAKVTVVAWFCWKWTMEGKTQGGWMRVEGGEDGEIDWNQTIGDWMGLAKNLRIVLFCYNGKPLECFEQGKKVN